MKTLFAFAALLAFTATAQACNGGGQAQFGVGGYGACGQQQQQFGFAAPMYQQQFAAPVQTFAAPMYGVQQFGVPVYGGNFGAVGVPVYGGGLNLNFGLGRFGFNRGFVGRRGFNRGNFGRGFGRRFR